MKTMNLKLLALAAVFSVVSLTARAQEITDPKYGATPEERKENVLKLNYLKDAYDTKNYNLAVKYMQELIASAPKASQNIYVFGTNIYKNKILRATSAEEKAVMLDSLMYIYDVRIANYGDNAARKNQYLENKAKEYYANRPEDRETVLKLLQEAIDSAGEAASPELVNLYFGVIVEDYQNDKVETDVLLNNYDRWAAWYETCTSPEKGEAKTQFEQLFISSGAANCDNLEKVYAPQFAANPNDEALVEKVFALLSRGECTSPFMIQVGEAYYKQKPSTAVALALAKALDAHQDFDKARHYLNEAIASETDPTNKALLAVQCAATELSQNNNRAAADYAKQAIDINPENGLAYLILAQAYAAGSAGMCGEFEAQTVRWLVVDMLTRARNLLSGESPDQAATASSLINAYTTGFPTKEEIFYRTLTSGDGYTVNCGWISGRTTVRPRP